MKFFGYLAIAFFSTSCFVFQDTEQIQKTEQENQYALKKKRAQDSVSNYIKRFTLPSETYFAYDFSELYELKPKEILEYEELVKQKKRLPLLENTYHNQIEAKERELDSLIAIKKKYIKTNRIYASIEIGHIYALKSTDSTIVTEQIFNLYPNFIVRDYTIKYNLKLSKKELSAYERYINRKPLFMSYNQLDDERIDHDFYTNLSTELDKREDKNSFLKHILILVDLIHQKGTLSVDFVAENIALNYLKIYSKNDALTINKKELVSSPTEGKSNDNKFEYQYTYYTSQGNYTVSFNKFLEIVEILSL